MLEFLNEIDTLLFLFLNGIRSEFWDVIMWHISGKKEWIPLYLLISGWMIFRLRIKFLYMIPFIVLLVLLSDQISDSLKDNLQRYRPSHDPEIRDIVNLVRNHRGGLYGFVSSHAANTFALASFTSLFFKVPIFSIFIFFWAALVSYSRIYLGVHYPGDIIFGALLGVLAGLFTYWLWELANKKFINRWMQK